LRERDRDSKREHEQGGEGKAGSLRAGSVMWGSIPGAPGIMT